MYVRIGSEMVDADEIKKASTFYSSVRLTYNNGTSSSIMCRSDAEAREAVDAVINAKNGVGKVYTTTRTPAVSVRGCTTDERISDLDRQMAALTEKRRKLQEQKAYEEGCEALATLLVGGVSAIADAIGSRRDAKKRK